MMIIILLLDWEHHEKKLPINGGQEYLPKGNEKGVMKVEVVEGE